MQIIVKGNSAFLFPHSLQLPAHLGKLALRNSHFVQLIKSSLPLPKITSVSTPIFANHLSHFRSAWSHITTGQWILSLVELEYTPQFFSVPPTPFPHPSSRTPLTSVCHFRSSSLSSGGHIGNSHIIRRDGILFPILSNPEGKESVEGSQAYFRPKAAKKVSKENKILNG